VRRLEVFGSICTDEFDAERSDVDFLVEYPPDYEFGPWLKRYLELKEQLEQVLGRPVDLVMTGAVRNRRFAQSIDETGQLLFAA
jgi:predicted nucleotidyltransferase